MSVQRYGHSLGFLLALVAVVLAGSLLLLMQVGRVAAQGHEVQRLQELKTHWQYRNAQLAAEIALLSSLDRVQREATSRLGMKPATQYLFVSVAAPSPAPTQRPAQTTTQPAAPGPTPSARPGIQGFPPSWLDLVPAEMP